MVSQNPLIRHVRAGMMGPVAYLRWGIRRHLGWGTHVHVPLETGGEDYCKSGNIRGTLIFAYFAQIHKREFKNPRKYLQPK